MFLISLGACGVEPVDTGSKEKPGTSQSALFMSGNTSTSGYYTYPARDFLFSGSPNCTFSGGRVDVKAMDVPNRFTVRDANGSLVATTAWLGSANYSGPWGMSLPATNASTASMVINRSGAFKLYVETSAQRNGITDAWEANSYEVVSGCSDTPLVPNPQIFTQFKTTLSVINSVSVLYRINGGAWNEVYPNLCTNFGFQNMLTPQPQYAQYTNQFCSNCGTGIAALNPKWPVGAFIELAVTDCVLWSGRDRSFGVGFTADPQVGDFSSKCGKSTPYGFVWNGGKNIHLNVNTAGGQTVLCPN